MEFRRSLVLPIFSPLDHFDMIQGATLILLPGGGNCITLFFALSHAWHCKHREFAMYFSCSSGAAALCLKDPAEMPSSVQVRCISQTKALGSIWMQS